MTVAVLIGWAGAVGGALWLALLALPFRPWSTAERLEPAADADADLSDVAVLIPARDEAQVIGATLDALAVQGRGHDVVVVDDQSRDGTAEIARSRAAVRVVSGTSPPPGWTGKLWALEQGREHIERPLVLLLDADIVLGPGVIAGLRARMLGEGRALVSVMASLRMATGWERLLLPAFVYFFKLLYPFRLSNGRSRLVAAAAGGCLMIEAAMLARIGGFAAVQGALIDDCALARAVKRAGGLSWIGLSHEVASRRAYGGLGPIWDMVARTAYVQLDRSPLWLALCTVVMALAFWAPVVGALAGAGALSAIAAGGLAAMLATYQPVLAFYRRSPLWALSLPLIGTLFLAMTWTSALRHWRGAGAEWKGRHYGVRARG
jgi:hopene-associated glycosyltransferase HpnB